MLNRLLTLAIALAVAYAVLTQLVPYLKNQFVSRSVVGDSPAASADAGCVDSAQRANDVLIDAARSYGQPPVDLDGWSQAYWEAESQIQMARSECLCGSSTCEAASRALDEMGSLLTNLDGMVRGDSPGFANPGHQQKQILQFLEQARSAADF